MQLEKTSIRQIIEKKKQESLIDHLLQLFYVCKF